MVVQALLITTFRRKRQADLREFEASLVYKVNSRTSRAATQRSPVLGKKQNKTKTQVSVL